jgi:SAM-dependent methyltransferase
VQSGDVRLSALAAKRVYADEAERADSESDAAFWARLPDEDMDANQRALLRELLGARLPAGRVLDLCAGSKSPLPRAFTDQLTGLAGIGAAQAALAANALLDTAVEGDLNADPTLPFGDAEFDAVVCACGMPYLSRAAEVLTEARRVLAPEGILALSWTSQPCQAKAVAGWAARSEAEQVELVKASLLQLGFHPRSLRVDISGPTGGAKLVVVSGSPAEPPRGAPQDTVADSVDTGTLKKTLAKVSKRRRDEKRQKEQDEKPFRIVVVSPPPTTALEGVFKLPARTHNGDKIEVNGNRYVVSKLRMNYVYRGGRYRLDEKIVEVQQQGRFETNERLNSLVLQDTSAETQ